MKLSALSKTLGEFLRNEAGTYVTVFALATPAIFGAVSASVEMSSISRIRAQLQAALDASALATGKHLAITTDEDVLAVYARDYFDSNLGSALEPEKISFGFQFLDSPNSGKRIRVSANYDYDFMMKFLGMDELLLNIASEVTAGNRTIEVAIVLDNSGSMDTYTGSSYETRLEKAQEAAIALSTQLYTLANISNKPDPVKIAVVPFGHSVNIGSANRGEDWMDMNGWSSIHHENLNWEGTSKRGDDWPELVSYAAGYKGFAAGSESAPPTSGTVAVDWLTRWTLFDALNVGWEGCVEMRPWPYHTTDDTPSDLNADTLFVPMFAPDEPDEENSYEDDDYSNSYLDDYYRAYANPDGLTYWDSYRGLHRLLTNIPGEGYNYGNYTRQQWRQDWAMKYNDDAKRSNFDQYYSRDLGNRGPNFGCTTDPITPLTSQATTIETAINAMDSGGYTNVQAGIAWGWRTLSPGEPFIQGRDYSVPENDKYIIVLTDGNNTYPSQSTENDSQYTSWGYEKHGRVFDGLSTTMSKVDAMNAHTKTTCDNIKAIIDADNEPAYKIFTIAYDVADGSSVKALLHDCASMRADGSKYYFDVSGDALAAAMQAIGNEISDLRISR